MRSSSVRKKGTLHWALIDLLRSFGFEFQGRSAFSGRARKRDPKTFSLAAHNQELVLRHMTFVLKQLFQISLETPPSPAAEKATARQELRAR
jgi:hypothetical protein